MTEAIDKKGLTEEQFLQQYNPDKYPKPSLTADIVAFRKEGDAIKVLLVRRGGHPFLGYWALPGGFAERNETLEQTAARELAEETGISNVMLTLIGVYSAPGRDPRGWVVSAAYAALIPDQREAAAGSDATDLCWVPLRYSAKNSVVLPPDIGRLAFDHNRILEDALCIFHDRLFRETF